MVRNELFRRVELAAARRVDTLGELDAASGWPRDRWSDVLDAYFVEHSSIGTGASACGMTFLQMEETGRTWRVRQILDDPAGFQEWAITAEVDLDASDEAGSAVVRVLDVGCQV